MHPYNASTEHIGFFIDPAVAGGRGGFPCEVSQQLLSFPVPVVFCFFRSKGIRGGVNACYDKKRRQLTWLGNAPLRTRIFFFMCFNVCTYKSTFSRPLSFFSLDFSIFSLSVALRGENTPPQRGWQGKPLNQDVFSGRLPHQRDVWLARQQEAPRSMPPSAHRFCFFGTPISVPWIFHDFVAFLMYGGQCLELTPKAPPPRPSSWLATA